MRATAFFLPALVVAGGGSTAAMGGAIFGIIAGAAISSSSSSSEPSGGTVTHNITRTDLATGNTTRRVVTESWACHDGPRYDVEIERMYFTAPNRTDVADGTVFSVVTPWYITYHKRLRKRFERELRFQSLSAAHVCGWFQVAEVKALRVWRGDVEFYNSVYMKDSVDVDEGIRPSAKVIGEIENIMVKTYPVTEIVLIVVFTAGLFLTCCACCCCCAMASRKRRSASSMSARSWTV